MYQLQNKNPLHQDIYFKTLTYKMEALSELSRIHQAYEVTHEAINALGSINYSENIQLTARSTANQRTLPPI